MRGGAWRHKVDVSATFKNEDLSFEKRRDGVVLRLRSSQAAIDGTNGEELIMLLEDLAETTDTVEFDSVWDDIYNLADSGKWLWIDTI